MVNRYQITGSQSEAGTRTEIISSSAKQIEQTFERTKPKVQEISVGVTFRTLVNFAAWGVGGVLNIQLLLEY
jgi:hypothetical protein